MSELKFDWNPQKAIINEQKHKVTFEEAKSVFYDENARLIYDPEHSLDEDRYIILGMSDIMRLLIVCHVYQENDECIRIISARLANKQERQQYRQFLR
jgi:uncharacterized DUF497 family protein